MLRVAVHANGCAAPPQMDPHVLGEHERHGVQDTPKTGIGLACVNKQSTAMGGRCGYLSEAGISMFWFEVPYRPDPTTIAVGTEFIQQRHVGTVLAPENDGAPIDM